MQEIEKDITSIDAVQVQVSPSSATDDTSSINEMLKDDAVSSSLPSSASSLSWKPITASIIDSDSDSKAKANDVVTLRDIQNAVPQESQEESFVMDKIEQNDPSILDFIRDGEEEEEDDEDDDSNLMTSSRRSTFSKGTSLPDVIVESMQEEKRKKQQRQHRRQKTQDSSISNSSGITNPSRLNNKTVSIKSKSSKPKTIEEELFDLTNSLRPQQSMVNLVPSNIDNENNDISSENVDGTTNIEVEEELRPLTQAEKFANTANQMLENIAETDIADLEEQQQEGEGGEGGSLSPRSSSTRKKKIQNNDHWQNMQEIKRIIYSNRTNILRYARGFMLYMILPATFVAFLLFYAFNNPHFETRKDVVSNRNEEGEAGIDLKLLLSRPSYSWIVLFFGVRQVITFSVALAIEWLVITYYQEPGIKFKIVRPMARLFIIQAHGIPLLLIFWGILNLVFLQGSSKFARHWIYYLPLGIFNGENPSGFFTNNQYYKRVLYLMVGTGAAMAAKRFLIGLRFGQNSYHRYADRLTSVLKQMLRVSKLARLSELNKKLGKDAEHAGTKRKTIIEDTLEIDFWLQHNLYNINDDDTANNARGLDNETNETNAAAAPDTSDDVENNDGRQPAHGDMNELLTGLNLGSFADGSTNKITEMLGEWEDIELAGKRKEKPSLSAIVQFGSSLGVLNSDHPFGQYFGYCPTRYDSVECSQRIYSNLLKVQNRVPSIKEVMTSPKSSSSSSSSSDESTTDATLTTLKFHTIALIAIDETGELDTDQVKQLMKLYRPTRDGDISLIDFCKSVDSVYKEIRKLRASVANEVIMNAAAEKLIDFLFYTAVFILALVAVGVDVSALFLGLGTLIISLSFCIGGASSDVIKGLLFILLQRPYDIGDRIAMSYVTDDAAGTGSPGWTVTDLTLYHTTLCYGSSLETATINNGAMANLRIINSARSPRAQLQFYMKFGVSVKPETIEEFKNQLFRYIRSKPRQWLCPLAFRLSKIAADLGYVEYFILLQHRESWQQIGGLLNSLSDVQQFSFELSTSLGMDFQSPALPIHFDSSSSLPEEQSVARSIFGGINLPLMAMLQVTLPRVGTITIKLLQKEFLPYNNILISWYELTLMLIIKTLKK